LIAPACRSAGVFVVLAAAIGQQNNQPALARRFAISFGRIVVTAASELQPHRRIDDPPLLTTRATATWVTIGVWCDARASLVSANLATQETHFCSGLGDTPCR